MRGFHMKIAAACCLACVLSLPGLARAAETAVQPDNAMIGNGVVTLGVRGDGGLAGVGLGEVFLVTSNASTTSWDVSPRGAAPGTTNASVEAFLSNGVTALSIVRIDDPAVGGPLRVIHNFRPSQAAPNLYEVTVTIQNI